MAAAVRVVTGHTIFMARTTCPHTTVGTVTQVLVGAGSRVTTMTSSSPTSTGSRIAVRSATTRVDLVVAAPTATITAATTRTGVMRPSPPTTAAMTTVAAATRPPTTAAWTATIPVRTLCPGP